MKLFMLGDFQSENGPGNANKQIKSVLSQKFIVTYSSATKKVMRLFEAYNGIKNSDILILCSKSNINYIAIKIAKKMNRKVIYLMHGCASLESKIANPNISRKSLKKIESYEKFIYTFSDCIVCVSKHFMEFMKKQIPEFSNKLDYIFNIVDIKNIENLCKEKKLENQNKILSVGGGMKRKNNLILAEIVDKYFPNVTFTVVGAELEEGKNIKAIPCVNWIEHLPHDKLCQLMGEHTLYIQNSSFETFGLAVIEALYAGCSLLLSKEIGCIDLFETITDNDIINDVTDEEEIRRKIKHILQEPNNKRLKDGFKKEYVSKEWQLTCWDKIIQNII